MGLGGDGGARGWLVSGVIPRRLRPPRPAAPRGEARDRPHRRRVAGRPVLVEVGGAEGRHVLEAADVPRAGWDGFRRGRACPGRQVDSIRAPMRRLAPRAPRPAARAVVQVDVCRAAGTHPAADPPASRVASPRAAAAPPVEPRPPGFARVGPGAVRRLVPMFAGSPLLRSPARDLCRTAISYGPETVMSGSSESRVDLIP